MQHTSAASQVGLGSNDNISLMEGPLKIFFGLFTIILTKDIKKNLLWVVQMGKCSYGLKGKGQVTWFLVWLGGLDAQRARYIWTLDLVPNMPFFDKVNMLNIQHAGLQLCI